MIVHNAIGKKREVKELLRKSMLQMSPRSIDAWMEQVFDPNNMFCFYEENILVSILQSRKTQIQFNGYTIALSTIELAATLPDYQKRGYFKKLLDAFVDQASHNELLSYVYTKAPKLFESRSFTAISKTKEHWILTNKCEKGNAKHVSSYRGENLYPLYQTFMSHFDGSLYCTEKEFDSLLRQYLNSHKQIAITKNEQSSITGFACYENINNYTRVHFIIYLNSTAMYDLLKFLSRQRTGIQLITSQFERLDKLMSIDKPKDSAYCMFRLNNYKLFSELTGANIRNIEQAFKLLNKPSWNHISQIY